MKTFKVVLTQAARALTGVETVHIKADHLSVNTATSMSDSQTHLGVASTLVFYNVPPCDPSKGEYYNPQTVAAFAEGTWIYVIESAEAELA